MKLEVITITKEDIAEGVPNDCWHCPASISVQRHFLPRCRFDRVSIDNGIIHVSGVGIFFTPEVLNEWIADFDSKGQRAVKPITFELWNVPHAYGMRFYATNNTATPDGFDRSVANRPP